MAALYARAVSIASRPQVGKLAHRVVDKNEGMVALDTLGHTSVAAALKNRGEEQSELAVDVEQGTKDPTSACSCKSSISFPKYPVIC